MFDIGGPEVLSYQALMDIYAEEAGLGRRYSNTCALFYAAPEFLLDSIYYTGIGLYSSSIC